MDRVPLEVIARHACRSIGDFFAEQAEKERRNKKVAVLVEDFTNSLYYMPCDEYGYPNYYHFNYMTFDSMNLNVLMTDGATPMSMQMSIKEVSIMLEKPLISHRYGVEQKPMVFMWSGRKISTKDIPLEMLNVSELMKLAQKAIIGREGLIIDDVMKNKIYK